MCEGYLFLIPKYRLIQRLVQLSTVHVSLWLPFARTQRNLHFFAENPGSIWLFSQYNSEPIFPNVTPPHSLSLFYYIQIVWFSLVCMHAQLAGSICIKNWKLKKIQFVVKSLHQKNNLYIFLNLFFAQMACGFAWTCKFLQASRSPHL